MKLKPILITLAVLAVLAVAGIFIGRQVLIGYLTPEFLTEQIESRWNCRAEIESVDSSLLGTSKVTISGLALYPRDDPAGTPETAPIYAESAELAVLTKDLVMRKLNIKHLELSGVTIRSKVARDGGSTVAELFKPLDDVATAPSAEVTTGSVESQTQPANEGDLVVKVPDLSGESTEEGEDSFDAGQLPLALIADRVEIKDLAFEGFLEASGATIYISDAAVAFTDIDVNPRNLNGHNRANFQFGGDLKVVGADKADLATAHIGGLGNLRPFDAATGQMDPAWAVDLTISKGAKLNTFPVLEKMREMLEEIDTAGIDLSNLELRGELMADAQTRIEQVQGKYLFAKPLVIQLPDTGLAVKDKSWLDTGTNLHRIEGSVILSEAMTQNVEKMVDQYLAKKMRGFRINGLQDMVLAPVKKGNRIVLDVVSEGDMSKPKADIVTPFGNLSEVIGGGKDTVDSLEKVGKDLLKGLLGN